MSARPGTARRQRGVALVTSLILLLIITILGMSLFRSFGVQEKIAGNLREKERALHSAEAAQQYAEWWLLQGANTASGSVACQAPNMNANVGQGQICNQNWQTAGWSVTAVPWPFQVTYQPPGMSVTPGVNGANGDPPYAGPPAFYIADVGLAADAQGEAYQINSYGYGGALSTVAVVESLYEVQQGVVNRGGL